MVTMGLTTDRLGGRRSARLSSTGLVVVRSGLGVDIGDSGASSLAVPVVTVGLTADGLGGRGSKGLALTSLVIIVILLVGGSGGLGGSESGAGGLAVPVIAMRLTTDRLGGGGSQSLGGQDGGEEAQEGDGEGGGLHLDLFCGGVERC